MATLPKLSVIAAKVDPTIVARLDALRAVCSRPGARTTRSDALRVALLLGIEALERGTPGAASQGDASRAAPRDDADPS